MVKNRKLIKDKILYLLDFAIEQSKTDNPYIKEYINLAFRLSRKINFRIPPYYHLFICKNCYNIRNLKNTQIRIESRKVNKIKNKYIKIHCLDCNYIKKINISKIINKESDQRNIFK